MNINEVRTKLMRHDHLTIKQDDTGSVVELALYDAAGTVLKSVHGSCTVTLRNVNTGAVNLTKTAAITNGELSFTIDKHLEASPHTLEIVTSDGKRFPANGNFVVDITKSHKTAIVDIIQNITREEAIRDVTKAVTEYVHSHANTFRGEKGDKGDAATITENKVLSDGSISLTFSDKTVVIIPKGVKGDRGATGPKGEQGVKGDTGPKGETGAKGDKGDRGDDLTIDGVVDSVDSLPDGTTASNYLVGNDLYFRVAGQSKWQKGLTLKNEVTIKDGFFYIDGKKTTASANESQAIEYAKKYVQSRGQNLVTNGTGLLGDNTNFPDFTFVSDDVKVGGGSFYSKAKTTRTFSSEIIPVDADKTYRQSAWIKSKNGVGLQSFGVQCLDIDGKPIQWEHYLTDGTGTVFLTKPLKQGDTEVHVSDVSPWLGMDSAWKNSTESTRGLVLWGYVSDTGKVYKEGEYSRYNHLGITDIDAEKKVLTLSRPFRVSYKGSSNGEFPAGHKLSRVRPGPTYTYNVFYGKTVEKSWTKYTGYVAGQGLEDYHKFRPATAFVQILILLNYEQADEVWYSGIEFKEVDVDATTQDLVLLNGWKGSAKYVVDDNNLVTLAFDVTAGDNVAGAIASLPVSHAPKLQLPIPAYNASTSVSDIYCVAYPGALACAKTLTKGQRYVGQITYRLGV